MVGPQIFRAWAAATVLVVSAGAGILVSAGPASAAAKTVTCTSLSGNLNTSPITFHLGGCSSSTGGSGTAQGFTITWMNGRTTDLATQAFPLPTTKPHQARCASLSDRYAIKDQVVGDSTGAIKVGGNVTAEVCILNEVPDPWSLSPGSVLKIR